MNKEERAVRRKKIIKILSLALIILILGVFAFIAVQNWQYWFGLEKQTLYASINISSDMGMFGGGNISELAFGRMKAGGSAAKIKEFENSHDFPVTLKISVRGNIAPLMVLDDNITLAAHESKRVSFGVTSQEDTKLGLYEGYVDIRFLRARE